ncbi:MAG: hydrolase [Microbacteriaceae bacterium]|jgi:HAD superfamily hydrolase (TIGR01509 family)|nr:hydrolase [Microbacteriaceae bacterium]
MDGTIVDTEPYWMRAETLLVESFGGTWSHEDALGLVGQGLWHSARRLQARGVTLTEDEIIQGLTRSVMEQIRIAVPWRPGAMELLAALRKAGIPTALVTMSLRNLAELVVESMGFAAFDAIVSGDDVTHSKPHPEPYLRGAELLGVPIADCVAIEDSEPGLASAVASGAVSIGVPHVVPIPESDGHTLWPTLAGRTIDDLTGVFTAARNGTPTTGDAESHTPTRNAP